MARRYESAVRDERTQKTRLALLEACEALLLELPIEEVTIPAVARRAGVTKPTAYSHFPDADALMTGVLGHVRERIGMGTEGLATIPPSKLPAATKENFGRFEASSPILRRLMESPSYERVRLSRDIDRAAAARPIWGDVPGVTEAELRERLGAIYLLVTPASWRWLRDTWGLSAEAAARAAAWAMQTLVENIGEAGKKKETEHENSSRQHSRKRARTRRARAR